MSVAATSAGYGRRAGDTQVRLSEIRRMFEGVIPAVLCTASAEGVPHLCYLSQAEYVDEQHVALSFQFFNRSRQNILATRRAAITVDDPYTAGGVRLQLEYLRTESEGPLFERMKAKLAGIASHSGMDKVYHLRGSDVYRVLDVQRLGGRRELAAPKPRCDLPAATRRLSERLAACAEMGALLDEAMTGLQQELLIGHAMLLLLDRRSQRLYAVASHGYADSGLGAEIEIGQGVAGIAAREGVALRVGHLTLWQTYARAIRQRAEDQGLDSGAEDIPMPGLAEPRSQMAVPLKLQGQVLGVLLLESEQDQHFSYDDEDALSIVATQLALAMSLMQSSAAEAVPTHGAHAASPATPAAAPEGEPVLLRHYAHNDSVFLGSDYLIKGVAGAILALLAQDWLDQGRAEFSNRELRLDPRLTLPDVVDNLEARLLLLQRRLDERTAPLRIEKSGRGRWRLRLARPLRFEQLA
jgi:adenylate cyclase